jgi:hypothetical protein
LLCWFLPGDDKKAQAMALGDAVSQGIIANETLAYFIGRTWLFFLRVGVDPKRMRFRQHLQHEMAHYAGALLGWWSLNLPSGLAEQCEEVELRRWATGIIARVQKLAST